MYKRIVLLLLIAALVFLCVSCSNANPKNSGPEATSSISNIENTGKETGSKDKPTPNDTPKPENKPDNKPEVTPAAPETPNQVDIIEPKQPTVENALRLYLEYIQELRNGSEWNDLHGTFSLVFIDDDDIPELVVDRSYPQNGIIICTVHDGAVVTVLAEGAGGGINYIKRGNKFIYIAIKQDICYDVIGCIEGGKFVTLQEGSRDSSGTRCYWDGKAVSFNEYFERQSAAFSPSQSEYTGGTAIRAADMIYGINMQLYGSPSDTPSPVRDPKTGLLTSDGAYAMYEAWQESHPDMIEISRQSSSKWYNGEQYYLFPAKYMYMYYYNIFVHMKTGSLLHMLVTDGMQAIELIEPLDNFYKKAYRTSNFAPVLDIVDYSLPYELNVGDIFIVRGMIESSHEILSVSVKVYSDSGEVEIGNTAYPHTKKYNLGKLDNDLLFNILTPGIKRYEIEATDATGTITLNCWFDVFA